ncbi:MAG: hypothetical protein J5509_01370 [Lachnospiraceae bacterium]|nr:hypothetical protein [Lachnospiraceae bacterium]
MKYCPSCKAHIEGDMKKCPLCQNNLQGEASERVYPSIDVMRKQSMLYKIQMFLALTCMIVSLACEFLLDVKTTFHWSLLVCVWVIGGELWLAAVIRGHHNPSKVVTLNAFWAAVLIMFTFILIRDIRPIYFWYIMPSLAVATEVLLFIFMMIDKARNAMPYLLGCSFLCIIMGVLCMIITGERSVMWVVCMMIGVVGFMGAVVFKGKRVPDELQRRFHV